MQSFELSVEEVQLLCDSLEELYDNLQYENITDEELKTQQRQISKLVAKLLQDQMSLALLDDSRFVVRNHNKTVLGYFDTREKANREAIFYSAQTGNPAYVEDTQNV